MYYFTSAPASYDYAYVTTVSPANLPGWRVIRVEDLELFNGYQVPRYGSGLHPAFKVDSPEATAIGLIYDATTQEEQTNEITIHRTNETKAGCCIWNVHLDNQYIGWIEKDRATRDLLGGWWFNAEQEDDESDPLGPRTNVIFNHGTRTEIVNRLQHLANNKE